MGPGGGGVGPPPPPPSAAELLKGALPGRGSTRAVLKGGFGGGSGAQQFVYQKRPDHIFQIGNFVFSHDDHFGLGGRGAGGGRGGGAPPLQKNFKHRPGHHGDDPMGCLRHGPWLGLDGPSGHYVGPHGRSSTRIVTKRSPKPILRATEGFQKKSKCEKKILLPLASPSRRESTPINTHPK